ncbi:MAG: YIP1 family protein [Alphaproteobacteria bacterium]|nr:YIP1 family protein [Alphaproteobacteria bacterium]
MELDFAAIIGRAQRLILSPSTEWDVIAGEPADVQKIYMNYVGPLVIAAAVASAIGFSLVGIAGFRMPIGSAFTTMILQIVLGLVMVYVLAFVINALAPTFGATQDMGQAFKLAAYAPTASWVAGLLAIIPALGIIGALGSLYTLYLLFVGLPKLMKPPEDKALTYTLAVIGVMVVIAIVLYSVQSSMMPSYTPMMRNY